MKSTRLAEVAARRPAASRAQRAHAEGVALMAAQKWRQATNVFEKALKSHPGEALLWLNLAQTLRKQGHAERARAAAERACALAPECKVSRRMLALCQMACGEHERAHALLLTAVDDDDASTPQVLVEAGEALHHAGRYQEAIETFMAAAQRVPHLAAAHVGMANAFERLGMPQAASECFRTGVALQPANVELRSAAVHSAMLACRWDSLAEDIRELRRAAAEGGGHPVPFQHLAMPDIPARELRASAAAFAARNTGHVRPLPAQSARRKAAGERLRIGYLSGDFHDHATSRLLVEVLERHDRTRFEVFLYSYGPDDGSAMRQRVERSSEHFVELREVSQRASAERIRADRIDILVDLKGYTFGCRVETLAYRPAPVQVNYLGFPGSLGATFYDYIVGDPVVTPLDLADDFSERIAQLPHSYQPNDRSRPLPPAPQRSECGLPEQGFVFCCFNNTYKITPRMFDLWCRLLNRVPGSVLWLLEANLQAKSNLLREAGARGIGPERIVFAPSLPQPAHLARLQLADLVLDTLPYNAHTTASDALWVGVPVVTCPGETFASRVAASLLAAAGLSETTVATLQDYESLAVALARDAARYRALRARLREARASCALFDADRYARDLEALLTRMHEAAQVGAPLPNLPAQSRPADECHTRRSSGEARPPSDALFELLRPLRRTAVVDIGANPIDGSPVYRELLMHGLCTLVGFEPQEDALRRLQATRSEHELYLPYAIGDGTPQTLRICRADGMTSLLEPDPSTLALFNGFAAWGEVVAERAIDTRRLDEVAEIAQLDFLKIDVQGAELAVLRGGRERLAQAAAVQIEVSFIPLYRRQPVWAEIDLELRALGFVPHAFAAINRRAIAPMQINGSVYQGLNQLLEADVVYVRDFIDPKAMSDEQLKHLALIAHHCYGSVDLANRCVGLLVERGTLPPSANDDYLGLARVRLAA